VHKGKSPPHPFGCDGGARRLTRRDRGGIEHDPTQMPIMQHRAPTIMASTCPGNGLCAKRLFRWLPSHLVAGLPIRGEVVLNDHSLTPVCSAEYKKPGPRILTPSPAEAALAGHCPTGRVCLPWPVLLLLRSVSNPAPAEALHRSKMNASAAPLGLHTGAAQRPPAGDKEALSGHPLAPGGWPEPPVCRPAGPLPSAHGHYCFLHVPMHRTK
jgi:hypothetical protein